MTSVEDALAIPQEWRRYLHPRRGGTPGTAIRLGPASVRAARALAEEHAGALESLLAGGCGDPELTGAARRHLGGEPGPVGAAVVATVLLSVVGYTKWQGAYRRLIDGWAAEHGVGFAACAVVEQYLMVPERSSGGPWDGKWLGAVYRKDTGHVEVEPLRRVRSLLAAAGEEAHADAVARLAGLREKRGALGLVSYLVPERRDWLEAARAPDTGSVPQRRWMLYCTADDPAVLGDPPRFTWQEPGRGVLTTMADAMGVRLLPFLTGSLDDSPLSEQDTKLLYETIAVLPSDAAFQTLLDRRARPHAASALAAAMHRFPVRAMRLLADAGETGLLDEHVRAHPEAVAALPDDVRTALGPLPEPETRVPDAAPGELPAFLTDLPWNRPVKPVVPGLEPPAGCRITWPAEDEREGWLATTGAPAPDDPDWPALRDGYHGGGSEDSKEALLLHGPEDIVRPLLTGWDGTGPANRYGFDWPCTVIARYGADAYPMAWSMAQRHPAENAFLLRPYLSADVALLMAGRLRHDGPAGRVARDWFDRHGPDAVPYLAPAALGTAATPRRHAETALRRLAARHGPEEIAGAVPEAAAELRELLTAHPAQTGNARRVKPGTWLTPDALPQVRLRGRARALPAAAVAALVELLTLSVPYGRDAVREACDPASLAEFGWALFDRWRATCGPMKDGWALTQLGTTGDDGIVSRLSPLILAWPKERGSAKAVRGLDVLVTLGTDAALRAVRDIGEQTKSDALQEAAEARFARGAAARGLTAEQLGDRLVPTFGLDGEGTLVVDYGVRSFTVGFDEQLKPVVADADGTPRRTLPRPAKKDDPELAPAAYAAFMELKKDVRAALPRELRRLQEAMTRQRRWSSADFRDDIAGHPLLWRLARRLVWSADDAGATVFFRIAEDRTFADVDDDAFTPPDTAGIGLAHPVRLGADLKTWGDVLADYEILQPFPQLGHPFRVLSEKERASGELTGFPDIRFEPSEVYRLNRRGWEWIPPDVQAQASKVARRVADDRYIIASFSAVDQNTYEQRLSRVWVATRPDEDESGPTFGELDPVAVSEALITLPLGEAAE